MKSRWANEEIKNAVVTEEIRLKRHSEDISF